MVMYTYGDFGILKPKKYWSCDRPIMMAAAEVKPEMTGWARKETRKPCGHEVGSCAVYQRRGGWTTRAVVEPVRRCI